MSVSEFIFWQVLVLTEQSMELGLCNGLGLQLGFGYTLN